jgi:hypothetical protein
MWSACAKITLFAGCTAGVAGGLHAVSRHDPAEGASVEFVRRGAGGKIELFEPSYCLLQAQRHKPGENSRE